VSAELGTVLVKLASQYLLPVLVEEATKLAAQKAVRGATFADVSDHPGAETLRERRLSSALVISNVPGRLRFRPGESPPVKMIERLRELDGVISVFDSLLTGNVLVHYDSRSIGPSQILTTVDQIPRIV
jgi:hypothetical protein